MILQLSGDITRAQMIMPDQIVLPDNIEENIEQGLMPSPDVYSPAPETYAPAVQPPDPYVPYHEPEIAPPPAETVPEQPSGSTAPSTPVYVPPTIRGTKTEDLPEDAKVIDAPYINQRASYPNGCEAVSAVMLLQYLGVDTDARDFIRSHLDMGRSPYVGAGGEWFACDPREQYPGNPANSSGWGCYPEVIKKAVDSLAPEGFSAYVLKDAPLSTLISEYIDNDIPVLFWGTIDMRKPTEHVSWTVIDTDRTHTWISPFHCLLLVGYDSEGYYFNDPWQDKLVHYDKKDVELSYSGMGREALVVLPTDNGTAFVQ